MDQQYIGRTGEECVPTAVAGLDARHDFAIQRTRQHGQQAFKVKVRVAQNKNPGRAFGPLTWQYSACLTIHFASRDTAIINVGSDYPPSATRIPPGKSGFCAAAPPWPSVQGGAAVQPVHPVRLRCRFALLHA